MNNPTQNLSNEALIELFRKKGALLQGHFVLSSGLHSRHYMQCALLLQYPELAESLGHALADKIRHKVGKIDKVVSPALGGLIIGHEVARALTVPHIFTERKDNLMQFRRGFAIQPGEKIVVIEDVTTTGGSVKEVLACVKAQQGEVVAVASIIDRSGGTVDFACPFLFLGELPLAAYPAENCPLCAKKIPVEKPGSKK